MLSYIGRYHMSLRHVIIMWYACHSSFIHNIRTVQRVTKVSPFWGPPIRIIAFNIFQLWCGSLFKTINVKYWFNTMIISRPLFMWLLHVNLFMKINGYKFCLRDKNSSFSNNAKLTPKLQHTRPVLLNLFSTVMRKWVYCNPAHFDVSAALPNLVVCLCWYCLEEIWVNLCPVVSYLGQTSIKQS